MRTSRRKRNLLQSRITHRCCGRLCHATDATNFSSSLIFHVPHFVLHDFVQIVQFFGISTIPRPHRQSFAQASMVATLTRNFEKSSVNRMFFCERLESYPS